MRRFWAALTFYTTLPLGRSENLEFTGIAAWLPAVGLVIGGILCLIGIPLRVFPDPVRAALLLAVWVLLTGGLHLDGVADTADGLAINIHQETLPSEAEPGVQGSRRRLEVMQDSHTGAYGVMALILLLLLKFAALTHLRVGPWLLLVPAWGRWGQLLAVALYPYLRQQGSGRFLKESTPFPAALWPGTALLLGLTAGLAWAGILNGQLVWLWTMGAATGAVGVGYWINRQLGGHTGDTYGATLEWSEAIALLWGSLFWSGS
ncbi:adenosylcobinamide-GDP ribazoletransferase [Synechococcus sp. Nb3U1]|uniref:adenosylcobinamide-GDP ribazoletransferase n=1 Tax=Synechococcus sp. Nb3U1 TaxID=1914529 RepID=UPI001F489F29|nr:adenosylcobinamide-GDP ribazoletransferase [Synechococcus sp. Nb3U1]MCF2971978.1 adenosylcobinamide-GDP ribazoletransferase [Synechococcus sp. Nb3U1]